MKEKTYYHKLIRDKIPEIIESFGNEYETRTMDDEEFVAELKKKLLEEVKELVESSDENILNELADVLEIIKTIGNYYKINFTEIEKNQIQKRVKRGGFDKKLFLIWSTDDSK